MSDYKAAYLSQKKQVLQTLETAEAFLRECGHDQEAKGVAAQRNNLESGEFSIALVGEFSAGKSTFLNALMRERILPSFTRETTATINFLRHKQRAEHGESGCVYYKNGKKQTIDSADLETISRFVSTESKEMDVAQQVDHLDLFLNSRFLEDNVMLVDTPGLNGIAERHKELTQSQIERSSAGIFLFDAHQPGSSTDFEILDALSKRVKSILLVLNKIDVINIGEGDSVERVVQNLKDSYRKLYPNAKIPEIWPVSAYKALVARSSEDLVYNDKKDFTDQEKATLEAESGMGEFEERLWKFLTQGEKAKQMLLTPVTQAIGTLDAVKEYNKAGIDALEGKVDTAAIEGKLLELEKAISELQDRLEENRKALREDVNEKEKDFYREIDAEGEICKKGIVRMVENFTDVEEITPESLSDTMKRRLRKISIDAWIHYNDGLRDVMSQHCQSVTEDVNRMLDNAELGISLDSQLTLPEYKLGLENYAERVEQLEKEQAALEHELEEVQNDWQKELELQQKRNAIQDRLEHERGKRETMEQNKLMMAPSPEVRQREVMETISRGGLLGGLLDFVIGEKRVTRMESYIDRSALDEYNRRYDEMLRAADKNIRQIEENLANTGTGNVMQKEKAMERLENARQKKAEELRNFQEKAAEDYRKKNELQLKKLKNAVSEYFDDLLDDFKKECKKSFGKQRRALEGVMADGVRFSVSSKIELLKKDLEHQKRLSETAVNERDMELQRCNQENESIRELLKELLDIQSDLENIQVDFIKQEEF